MNHVIQTWDYIEKVHFVVEACGGEYTICGQAQDASSEGNQNSDWEPTNKKVNCPECIKIVKKYKAIKSSEMVRSSMTESQN